ncbi:hypothetical protein CASFOL_029841 [Castilleja foliolosa]|uniref:SMP domain-containing protein n=1 Tax=Castilleja foliolosa TaxID=1961234 RepID=A0ABD3C9Q4_9LAMI
MNQDQSRSPQEAEAAQQQQHQEEPIKYGDIFQVSGDLAKKPISPGDAAAVQAAESTAFGKAQMGGPAAIMYAAAVHNVAGGLGSTGGGDTDVASPESVTVVETRIITELVGGQVVGQYAAESTPIVQMKAPGQGQAALTIGQALEALAQMVGDKPIDYSDAAAIMAAECRATGCNLVSPGGLATIAQSAASFNAGLTGEEGKVKLADVLTGARSKLPVDKAATREDAEDIMAAELRSDPKLQVMNPGGVAAAVAQAVRMNEMAPAKEDDS